MILEKCTKTGERIETPGDPSLKYTNYTFPLEEMCSPADTNYKIKCKITTCEPLKPIKDYPNYKCNAHLMMNRFNVSLMFMDGFHIAYMWSSNWRRQITQLDEYFIADCVEILQAISQLDQAEALVQDLQIEKRNHV